MSCNIYFLFVCLYVRSMDHEPLYRFDTVFGFVTHCNHIKVLSLVWKIISISRQGWVPEVVYKYRRWTIINKFCKSQPDQWMWYSWNIAYNTFKSKTKCSQWMWYSWNIAYNPFKYKTKCSQWMWYSWNIAYNTFKYKTKCPQCPLSSCLC